jgi:hypothetical protein
VNNVTLVSLIVTVVAALAAGGAALLAANADGRIVRSSIYALRIYFHVSGLACLVSGCVREESVYVCVWGGYVMV